MWVISIAVNVPPLLPSLFLSSSFLSLDLLTLVIESRVAVSSLDMTTNRKNYSQICYGAAELLHTYFCCTQWHARAFDERLEDDAFLHTADASPTSPRRSTSAAGSSSEASGAEEVDGKRASDPRIKVLHQRLVRQRGAFWEEIEMKLVSVLVVFVLYQWSIPRMRR